MKNNRAPEQSIIGITDEANRAINRQEKRFRRRLQIYVAALLGVSVLALAPSPVAAQGQQDIRSVSGLNGTNGFGLAGISEMDQSGYSVSGAGDINADGFADIIIGAKDADSPGNMFAEVGASYVVFGKASGFAPLESLASLNGTNGFRLVGAGPDSYLGTSVSSAGDINGDGCDDILIGARRDENSLSSCYVVFGKASAFDDSIDVTSLALPDGFRVTGSLVERFGSSVSGAGDINGDGLDDIIIGAPRATLNGARTGASYILYGRRSGFTSPMDINSITPADGFRIDGSPADCSGNSVAGAGDVNGDGFDDVIIGAYRGNSVQGGVFVRDSGASYVLFGKAGFSSPVDLAQLDGSNGFRVNGNEIVSRFGHSVAGAGDVNGDGFADIIIGAPEEKIYSMIAGNCYIVFGKAAFSSPMDVSSLNGTGGFKMKGLQVDYAGCSVAGAGDVNGDGFGDIVIGAFRATKHQVGDTGLCDVVYGKASGFYDVNVHGLYRQGYTLYGGAYGADLIDAAGWSVSGVGDFNGDGFGDFIMGAISTNAGAHESGASYVVFGSGPATSSNTFKSRSRSGDAPAAKPGSVGDGSLSPNAARARIDFTAGSGVSQETVTLTRGTSGTVTGIKDKSTADVVWQITSDRADFGTAQVTLIYRDAEIARLTGVPESNLTIYKSETPDGPWLPLPTTVNTAKNEATAPVTDFSYFLLGDSTGLPVNISHFQVE